MFTLLYISHLPSRVPLLLPRVVIDESPSPVSMNMTCVFHTIKMQSGLPNTFAHVPVLFTTVHDGGSRSGFYKVNDVTLNKKRLSMIALVSLAAVFLDVTQLSSKRDKGALRDIQKTAARETMMTRKP